MIDTIWLRLTPVDMVGADLREEIPLYIDNPEPCNIDGILGYLGNLRVEVYPCEVRVRGSLCKWWFGDNFNTMGQRDVKRAIRRLSDTLHLPMEQADVLRIDIATNIATKHPVKAYLNHFGRMGGTFPIANKNGWEYRRTYTTTIIYDKGKEARCKRVPIPEPFVGRNLLRFEHRLIKNVASQLGERGLVAASLYEDRVFFKLIDLWQQAYRSIDKVNDVTPNFAKIKGVKELKDMCVAYTLNGYGFVNLDRHIAESQTMGMTTPQNGCYMRKMLKDVGKQDDFFVQSEALQELNQKIADVKRQFCY